MESEMKNVPEREVQIPDADKENLGSIYHALDDKKAENIRILDIHEVSTIGTYFVIASAGNQSQLLAMRDAVAETMAKRGIEEKQVEGTRSSTWILMDFGEIIVHLFTREDREFYDLDRIWKDSREITV